MSGNRISVSIDDLRVGATCSHPILDDAEILLLGANTRITQQVLNKLRDRGITSIEVDANDLAAMKGEKKPKPKSDSSKKRSKPVSDTGPLKESLVDRFDEPLCDQRAIRLVTQMQEASHQIEAVRSQLCRESLQSVTELVSLSQIYANTLVDDHDQTVGMLGRPSQDEELSQRSTRMSVIGMAVAVELGLSGQQTIEVGLAGVLHDLGLMVMEQALRQPLEWMTEQQVWEYKKHPLVAAAQIKSLTEVPPRVLLAIEQVHEQYDGSGYPRGVAGSRIHLYARILNVVEAYLQLISPTHHRPAIVAHDAIGLLLHQAGRGIFDPKVIRALLNAKTLFPLGSQVELGNGEAATVIRRPRQGYCSPVVMDSDGQRVELENSSLSIVRPIIESPDSHVRLTQEMMREMDWNPAEANLLIPG